jgi:2-polyprenyl-3-methyl-5-hydroxy-6-metoxy-1,4-benzoquinol methylase
VPFREILRGAPAFPKRYEAAGVAMTINSKTKEFVDQNGGWTAMAIKLSDGTYTRTPAPDFRLRRLLQVAQDVVKKPLSQCRVLDLACLEGHYAIEFALHGAEALGIEGRTVSVAKCDYVKHDLDLNRAVFLQGDVRDLSKEKHGEFDIVICSGILYHLPADDALKVICAMHDVCRGVVLIDTFVSLFGREELTLKNGMTIRGHHYIEHSKQDTDSSKQSKLWASIDNFTSFWFTEVSLVNLLTESGFTSVMDVLSPTALEMPRDRKTYLAIKGQRVELLSSDLTMSAPLHPLAEGQNPNYDASQTKRGPIFSAAKAFLPQAIKDAIKPGLRKVGFLPPDRTPEFQKRRPS